MAGVFAAMLWGFQAMILHHAPDMFRAPQEDMSFGWYVPLFSLYVVWTERKKILGSLGAPSWAGLLAALPFLALGFLGVRGVQLRFEIVAFVGLLITVPWAFFGKDTAKAILFPALFLLFCIPLATFLDVVTVHLRLLASSTAFAVARGVGADIVQQGTMVGAADGSFSIDVADPCSGLRSLFALMALTAGYAYFTQPTWLRRGILFAASVPIAILGNVMRILTIVLVANFASSDFATGFYHDYSGFVVFAVAILLMVATGEGITKIFERGDEAGQAAEDEGHFSQGACPTLAACRALSAPILAFALVVPLMFFQAATPDVTVAEAPNVHLAEIPGFSSEVLDGGKSKSSIHRPELCLPAQGLRMERPRTRSVAGRDWRFIDLASKDSPTFGFAYTFFNQEGFKTASHVSRIFRDVVDRSVLNRIDRWAMVTVNASRSDDIGLSYLLSRLELDGGDAK